MLKIHNTVPHKYLRNHAKKAPTAMAALKARELVAVWSLNTLEIPR